MRKDDLIGARFGKLTVLQFAETRNHRSFWRCRCDCGNEVVVSRSHLTAGSTTSCGCARKGTNKIDISGQKFNRLIAIEPTEERVANSIVWRCRCDCGNICYASAHRLRKGLIKSCGCYASEIHSASFQPARSKRGEYFVDGTDMLALNRELQSNNTSGHKGVSYDASVDLWKAYITFRRKRYYLGGYRNIQDAVSARQAAESIHTDFIDWYAKTYSEHKSN